MTPPVPRYNVLGVGVCALGPAAASERILQAARAGEPLAASALAVHAIVEAGADPSYRARVNSLDLALPDGQPVRWALNLLHGAGLRERVYGPFLMGSLCAAAAHESLPVFLFGSTDPLLGRLSARLCAAHPGLRIAGTLASRFRRESEAEAREDARLIAGSGARLVFCGIGCPRQEAWAHAMRNLIGVPIVAVGAAFALWAGERAMAPGWMQARGLEWLFRLGQEPRRLAWRYLVQSPGFLLGVALQKLGRKPPGIEPCAADPDYWG